MQGEMHVTHRTGQPGRPARSAMVVGIVIVACASRSGTAFAFVGDDPDPSVFNACYYSSATARLTPTGAIQYSVNGSCGNNLVSGQLAYDPNTKKFSERFFYQGTSEFRTTGTCAADPWATGAPCTDQLVNIRGDAIDQSFARDPSLAPVARHAASGATVLSKAAATATRPNPPAPPASVQARATYPMSHVQLRWLAPDESNNRPFVSFIVETRPAQANGAAWRPLGTVPRNGSGNYQAAFTLPPPVPGYQGWVVRACSTTVFAATCSPEIVPATLIQAKQLDHIQDMVKPAVTGVTAKKPTDAMVSSERPAAVPQPKMTLPPPKVTAPPPPGPTPAPAGRLITTPAPSVSGRSVTAPPKQ